MPSLSDCKTSVDTMRIITDSMTKKLLDFKTDYLVLAMSLKVLEQVAQELEKENPKIGEVGKDTLWHLRNRLEFSIGNLEGYLGSVDSTLVCMLKELNSVQGEFEKGVYNGPKESSTSSVPGGTILQSKAEGASGSSGESTG